MMAQRFSPTGSVLRGLVIATGCVALLWLGYLALLSEAMREEESPLFFVVMGCMIFGLFLGWRWTRGQRSEPARTFWLSQDGESAPSGPFTVGQIVSLWKQGQVTTRGMVTAEGEERWMPILDFADRFDGSLEQRPAEGFSLRRVVIMLLLCFVLIVVLAMGRFEKVPSTKSMQLREMLNSPAVRSAMEDLQRKAEKEVAARRAEPPRAAPSLPPAPFGGN